MADRYQENENHSNIHLNSVGVGGDLHVRLTLS